jgi:hypothetical protein
MAQVAGATAVFEGVYVMTNSQPQEFVTEALGWGQPEPVASAS